MNIPTQYRAAFGNHPRVSLTAYDVALETIAVASYRVTPQDAPIQRHVQEIAGVCIAWVKDTTDKKHKVYYDEKKRFWFILDAQVA